MSRRQALIACFLTLIVAFALRWHGVIDRTLSFDEAFSWRLVTAYSTWDVVQRTAADVHPPLYYLLLKAWTGVWGDGPVALRSLSILLACVSIPMIYVLSRDVYRWTLRTADERSARAAGVIAALLLTTSGAHIRWSTEARMYSLACLLGMASTWLLARCTLEPPSSRRGRITLWTLYALTACASLYTHNYMIFVFLGQVVWLVLIGFGPGANAESTTTSAARDSAGLMAVAGVCFGYAPWVPVLFRQADQVRHGYFFSSPAMADIARAWAELVIPRNQLYWGETWAAASVVLISALVIAWTGVSGRRIGSLIAAIVGISILIPVTITVYGTAIISNQTSRYWLVAYIFLLVATAVFLCRMLHGFERWIFALILIANQAYWWAEFSRQTRLDLMGGAKALAEYVRTHGDPDELVVVREPSVYVRVLYHMRNDPRPDRVQLLPRKALDHYNGGPVITKGEIKNGDILDPWVNRKVWAVDGSPLDMLLKDAHLPEPWTAAGLSETFPEPFLANGKVALTESTYGKRAD